MNAMVGERLYGNPNSHILQTRGVSRPPGCGVSIPPLSEGSGYYTGGPGPHEGSGTPRGSSLLGRSGAPAARARVPASSGTRGVSGPFPTVERSGPLLGEQDSGPQGSGCLDVVKDNYKILA